MKVRNDEGFLFPSSQYDFRGGLRGLRGLGAADPVKVDLPSWGSTYLYLKEAEQAAGLPRYPNLPVQSNGLILRSDLMKAQIAENPSLANNPDVVSLLNELLAAQASMGIVSQAAAPAVQQAAVQAATATQQAEDVANIQAARASADAFQAQQAAEAAAAQQAAAAQAAQATQAAAAAMKTSEQPIATAQNIVGYDIAIAAAKRAGKYREGMTEQELATVLTALEGAPVFVASKTVATAAASTQKTAVDTTSGAVQTTDTASGTTSTVNAATGRVTLTNTSGQTVTGTGSVAAGGVITTVDTTTGTVTTQNTNTGVVTQTNAATGQTVTAVQVTGTPATGGTFILPDGGTVTTTEPITGGGLDAGKIALVGLVGLLLLRGAIK